MRGHLTLRTVDYIRSQEEHHRIRTIQDEFLEFLKAREVDYDPKYLWD